MKTIRKCDICGKEYKTSVGIDGLPVYKKCDSCRKRLKKVYFSPCALKM